MADKTCFVIAPIGEKGSEIRKRSDQIFKHIITPVAEECDYDPLRADQISEPGMITSQVIQHIVNDPLVIADLSGRNPNVFYELALRHALRKPLVQIIKSGEEIPFDVAGTRTIPVDRHDLDSVETAKEEIAKQIKAIEEKPADIETPISVSIDLQNLKQSENLEQRSLGDLITVVTEIRTGLANVEKRLDNQLDPLSARQLVPLMEYATQARAGTARLTFLFEQLKGKLHPLEEQKELLALGDVIDDLVNQVHKIREEVDDLEYRYTSRYLTPSGRPIILEENRR
jgi:hypothetical protein